MLKTVLVTLIGISVILPSLLGSREGLIEVDYPYAEDTKLKVNVGRLMLFLASKITENEEPEVAEFLSGLRAVRVRIYDRFGLDGIEFEEVLSFYKRQLQGSEWDVLARVREEEENVAVYSLVRGDVISGLLVIVAKPDEIIVVNLAGDIDITNLAQIDHVTGVDLDMPEHDLKNGSIDK